MASDSQYQERILKCLIERKLVQRSSVANLVLNPGEGVLAALERLKIVKETEAMRAVASELGIPVIDLDKVPYNLGSSVQEFKGRVDPKFCLQHKVLPIVQKKSFVGIACANPFNREAIKSLEFALGTSVKEAIAEERKIIRIIGEYLDTANFSELEDIADVEIVEVNQQDDYEVGENPNALIRLCDMILLKGIREGASDIHIEPRQACLAVRLRIDGLMSEVMEIPKRLQAHLTSRLKLLAKMDISERRRPQDGRIRVRIQMEDIDLRVSSVPTAFGEKIVLRVLRGASVECPLDDCGMKPSVLEKLKGYLKTQGKLIITTGPTGSGKTTTLYACINELMKYSKNIETVEDPIEYRISGINQMQINKNTGVNFAAALRSILRQDPDVIMLGEIRDEETAKIAVQAAQTGHLVLSTLHTIDAPSAINRLLNMGVDKLAFANTLRGVIAQRLVRKLCEECKKETPECPTELERYCNYYRVSIPKLYKSIGCNKCGFVGFKKRLGLFSLFEINDRVADIIAKAGSVRDLIDASTEYSTLGREALELLIQGVTSYDEVREYIAPELANHDNAENSSLDSDSIPDTNHQESSEERFVVKAKGISPKKTRDKKGEPLSALEVATGKGEASKYRRGQDEKRSSSDNLIASEQSNEPERSIGGLGATLQKPVVLLIDDNRDVFQFFRIILEREQMEVVYQPGGHEALEYIYGNAAPDLILCDLMMPEMNGRQLISRLMRLETLKEVPILVLTAASSTDNEVDLLDLGARDFLAKDSPKNVIVSRIRRALRE